MCNDFMNILTVKPGSSTIYKDKLELKILRLPVKQIENNLPYLLLLAINDWSNSTDMEDQYKIHFSEYTENTPCVELYLGNAIIGHHEVALFITDVKYLHGKYKYLFHMIDMVDSTETVVPLTSNLSDIDEESIYVPHDILITVANNLSHFRHIRDRESN